MKNLPGEDYVLRIGSHVNDLYESQFATLRKLWNEAQAGKYSHASLASAWIAGVGSYYDLGVDISRGPGYTLQPSWLYLTYQKDSSGTGAGGGTKAGKAGKKGGSPSTLEGAVPIDRSQPVSSTTLTGTNFASFQGGSALEGV